MQPSNPPCPRYLSFRLLQPQGTQQPSRRSDLPFWKISTQVAVICNLPVPSTSRGLPSRPWLQQVGASPVHRICSLPEWGWVILESL